MRLVHSHNRFHLYADGPTGHFCLCRHPHSLDALCNLPPDLPGVDASSTILTGSSDGMVRAVKVLPTKLLGVVADHGDWPVERIAIGGGTSQLTLDESGGADKNGGNVGKKAGEEDVDQTPGRWWVGSVGHEEVVRLTDLEAFFHEAVKDGTGGADKLLALSEDQREVEDVNEDDGNDASDSDAELEEKPTATKAVEAEEDSDDEDEAPKAKKRKRKPEKNPLVKKKGKNSVEVETTFFDGL